MLVLQGNIRKKQDHSLRLLGVYNDLIQGKKFNASDVTERYACSGKSVHRDINSIRKFLDDEFASSGEYRTVEYDRQEKCYIMRPGPDSMLNVKEAFTVIKILLESRCLNKDEMMAIIDKILACCVANSYRKLFLSMMKSEMDNYIGPKHNKNLLVDIWELAKSAYERHYLEIDYLNLKKVRSHAKIKPVMIMMDQFYFYLLAFGKDSKISSENYTEGMKTYRVDRIRSYIKLSEKFSVPRDHLFAAGELRKRVLYMYAGRLQTITFTCINSAVEAALDRLPTAEIIKQHGEWVDIQAEACGDGIFMWLKSQGENVRDILDVEKCF